MSDFYYNRVNKAVVTPELLSEVLEMDAALPGWVRFGSRSKSFQKGLDAFQIRMRRLDELLDQKQIEGDRELVKGAVIWRLDALERFQARVLSGWTPDGAALPEFTHPAWLKAAAEEPLIEDKSPRKDTIFDPESFCRRLRGHAAAGVGHEQARPPDPPVT